MLKRTVRLNEFVRFSRKCLNRYLDLRSFILSPFEIVMLVCFGASWPVAVFKTYTNKSCEGKSFVFLWLIFIGYISGTVHKVFWNFDLVTILYVFNGVAVGTDLVLAYKYHLAYKADIKEPVMTA